MLLTVKQNAAAMHLRSHMGVCLNCSGEGAVWLVRRVGLSIPVSTLLGVSVRGCVVPPLVVADGGIERFGSC